MFLLRCRTSTSDPEAPSLEEAVERAAEQAADAGLEAVAVTELDSLDSVVASRRLLEADGIAPLVGMEWTGIGGGERLLLYARTRAGFRDLLALLARPAAERPEPPHFGLESLEEDGLFVLCNPPGSLMRSFISDGREREVLTILHRYLEWFGRRAVRVVLPPDVAGKGATEQRRALGIMAREGVRFVSLGCDEETGRPLGDEDLSDAYLRCQAAVQESKELIEGCAFRWTPPEGGLAQVTPGRGYRSESFVWDRCHQELVRDYGSRRKDAEKRLYLEFQAFRDAGMFDLLVGLSQVMGRTSLGCPLVWPVSPWATTTLAGRLLGFSSIDPATLGIEAEIPKGGAAAERGIDVTLLIGSGEWKRCLEAVEEVFGKEHVVFRRGKPVGRKPAEVDPDLFTAEGSTEQRPTPVTEIVVSRFRWLDFLPGHESEDGHLETTLAPETLDRMQFYRFHLRRDRLITIMTMTAREVSHQGRGLDLFSEPAEVYRFLTGSDCGRGILRLGVPDLAGIDNYLRLRRHAAGEKGARRPPGSLDEAVGSIAEAFLDDGTREEDRSHRLVFARKLFTVASMCLNYPRSYYTSLFSSVELDLEDLRKLMAEAMVRGVPVSGPDINKSEADTVDTSDGIRLGLRCIRGIGPVISRSLIGSRERRPFNSLQDLCRRTDRRRVNRRVLDRLIEFGALDNLEGDREAQRAALAWMLGESEGKGLRPRQLYLFSPPGGEAEGAAEPGMGAVAAEAGGELRKTKAKRLEWHIFDPEDIEAARRTFGRSGAEALEGMKRGGGRSVAGWGWVVDARPMEEGAADRTWGFLSDGEETIPVVFEAQVEPAELSGPWVFRGERAGSPAGRRLRLLPGTGSGDGPIPSWWEDLPVVIVRDIEPLSRALEQVERRERIALRVRRGDRRHLRSLISCLRLFRVRGKPGATLSIRGDMAWWFRHRLRRLSRGRTLPLDLAIRWLESLPVVEALDLDEKAGPDADTGALSAWQRRRFAQMSASEPQPEDTAGNSGHAPEHDPAERPGEGRGEDPGDSGVEESGGDGEEDLSDEDAERP